MKLSELSLIVSASGYIPRTVRNLVVRKVEGEKRSEDLGGLRSNTSQPEIFTPRLWEKPMRRVRVGASVLTKNVAQLMIPSAI